MKAIRRIQKRRYDKGYVRNVRVLQQATFDQLKAQKEYFETLSTLTKREQFAAAALQGICACFRNYNGAEDLRGRCKVALDHADEMMKLLEGGGK